jgi:hypothetical protein
MGLGRPGVDDAVVTAAVASVDEQLALGARSSPAGSEIRSGLVPPSTLAAFGLAGVIFCAVVVAAAFDLEWTSQGWDAFTQRAVVERVDRLGGTYYTTGTDQKGPLWLASYSVVNHLASGAMFWFGLGLAIIALAVLTGLAVAAVIDRVRPGRRTLAGAAGLATAAYLFVGPEEFSHLLYSRNLVALCFVAALAIVLSATRRPWTPRAVAGFVAGGALVGLGVQTMPASAGTALVFLLLVLWLGRRSPSEVPRVLGLPVPVLVVSAAAAVVFAAVPVWYVLRGAFDDYWQQWWSYNRLYSRATGLTLPGQIRAALSDFASYYGDHPVFAAGLAAFAVDTAARWRRLSAVERAVSLALPAWWLAECFSVAVSQRFFPHYLMLPFVPMAIMVGVVVSRWLDRLPPRVTALAPMVALLVVVAVPGWDRFDAGAEQAGQFDGLDDLTRWRAEPLPPNRGPLRVMVASLTSPDDYVYIWSKFPHYYSDVERTAASRYIENRWLTGEVFGLPGAHPDYVFPDAWQKWQEDLARTRPPLIVTNVDEPVPPESPLAELLARDYRLACHDGYFQYFTLGDRGPKACKVATVRR